MNAKVNEHVSRSLRRGSLTVLSFLLCLSATLPARAEDEKKEEGKKPAAASLGLAPTIPQASALPGGFTPAFSPVMEGDTAWHGDFHGYLSMPLKLGINSRAGTVTNKQYATTLHAPPVVPEYRDSFTYTASQPEPYVMLNFAYGNNIVTANVLVQARSAATAASFFDSSTRGGISDAFVSIDVPNLGPSARLKFNVGAFTNRFGAMGEYDEGKYGTAVIARTNGVGENIIADLALTKDWSVELQQGFQGQLDKAPLGIVGGDWNEQADPNLGTGLVQHIHGGLSYQGRGTLGLHYLMAWSQDERASQGLTPDGKIKVLGADLRFSLKRAGHLYMAGAMTDADASRSVGRVIEILNAPGGPGLMKNYLGPNSDRGTGKLMTYAVQYDVSIARLIYADLFEGQSRDIVLSLFGMQTDVTSNDRDFDGITKRKFGAEVGYSLLPWFAVSGRFDQVQPNIVEAEQTYSILSPRMIFRTDWQSRDQVVLQYSHYMNGEDVVVRSGTPAVDDPSINPDTEVVSLSATMWW